MVVRSTRFYLEQPRCERRAERQRHQCRDRHGTGHDEAELHEELADLPLEEGDRHEHRNQRRRGGNHRESDLAGAEAGSFQRTLALIDAALDVLEHDDRIVDHQADGEDQRQ